jgi:hypothetical protein
LESMGCGLVPVASDLPSGISEVVHDGNGIRIALDDEEGYANALISLAKDRRRLATFSFAASQTVRASHSTIAMARRWEAMLNDHLPATSPVWMPNCRAAAPMELDGRWQFLPALRPLRKLVKSFRN